MDCPEQQLRACRLLIGQSRPQQGVTGTPKVTQPQLEFNMAVTKEEYRKAIDILKEELPMQVQKWDQHTNQWRNLGERVRGQTAAYAALHHYKEKTGAKDEFRVLPKNEADKYREGFMHGQKAGPEEPKPRRPHMYMPEHL